MNKRVRNLRVRAPSGMQIPISKQFVYMQIPIRIGVPIQMLVIISISLVNKPLYTRIFI